MNANILADYYFIFEFPIPAGAYDSSQLRGQYDQANADSGLHGREIVY